MEERMNQPVGIFTFLLASAILAYGIDQIRRILQDIRDGLEEDRKARRKKE